MKFNETSHIISICVLILTVVYTLVYSGVSGILLCAAIAFIAAAFFEDLELVVAVTILFVLFYNTFLKRFLRRFEPFTNSGQDKSVVDSIVELVKPKEHFMEGFEDVSPDTSKPAATNKIADAVDPVAVKDVTAAVNDNKEKAQKETAKEHAKVDIPAEEFQSATNQLFKLGQLPSEHKDGPMLDSGSTLMKAMSSFDPETTQKMTQDTKQLLETQKSLMGMLTQMRPILADGKELLQTFGGMFGGQSMNMAGSEVKLGK